MSSAVVGRTNGAVANDRPTVKRGDVTRRVNWTEITPFPDNPIYERRLHRMDKEWDGYNHAIIGVPELADNSAGAFPDLPKDALLNLDANHRQALAYRHGHEKDDFIAKIHRGLSYSAMLTIKMGLAARRVVDPAEKFIDYANAKPNSDQAKIRDTVEGLGWRVTHTRQDGGLSCTRELEWIWARDHFALTKAIETYTAVWGMTSGMRPDRKGQSHVIKGLGDFWIRYPQANAQRVVQALSGVTVKELHDAGNRQKEIPHIKSVYAGVRYTIAQLYNKRNRGGRLDLL